MSATRATPQFQPTTPDLQNHLAAIYPLMENRGLDRSLKALIELRVSQINQCAFCVNMHLQEARTQGETEKRLDQLVVWRRVRDFTAAERAALAWAEALTVVLPETDYQSMRLELLRHFTPDAVAVMTTSIGMINLWNRFRVSVY